MGRAGVGCLLRDPPFGVAWLLKRGKGLSITGVCSTVLLWAALGGPCWRGHGAPFALTAHPTPPHPRRRRHWSRKKAALRAKRMAGQGLPRQFAAAAEQAAGAGGPSRPSDLSWIPERRDSEPDRRWVGPHLFGCYGPLPAGAWCSALINASGQLILVPIPEMNRKHAFPGCSACRASDWDEGAKGRGGSGAYRDAPWHRDRDSDRCMGGSM